MTNERDAAIERARAFMAEYDMYNYPQEAMADFALAETATLRAEKDRLRAAVLTITDLDDCDLCGHLAANHRPECLVCDCVKFNPNRFRQALNPTETTKIQNY